MKDAEDEAFDELAKRQGHWGGGYQAKRAMAADKLQEDLINYGTAWSQDGKRIDPMSVYKEPAQGPHGYDWSMLEAAQESLREHMARIKELEAQLAQPAQEPVAYVTGVYAGRFVVAPLNPAMVLPTGMALYSTPQHTATWVGLTDEEIKEIIGPYGDTPIKGYTRKLFDQIEAKLRSKNNG